MYVILTQIIYTFYVVHILRKMLLLKFIEPSVWPRTTQTWTRLITMCMRSSAAEHVFHSDFQPGRSRRVRRSSTNLLITGVTDWRLWFDWMVDTLNSCLDYLIHLLPCVLKSFMRYAFVYRALRWYVTKSKYSKWLTDISR